MSFVLEPGVVDLLIANVPQERKRWEVVNAAIKAYYSPPATAPPGILEQMADKLARIEAELVSMKLANQ